MRQSPVVPANRAGIPTYLARILDETRHDPYEPRLKPSEPRVCRECGAVYQRGRWCWAVAPPGSHRVACPACQRAHDHLPAGTLTLTGPFVLSHRDELLAIVANVEAREKSEHPMHRVLAIEQHPESVVVLTSDLHLPRRIGEALARAHGGKLDASFLEDEYRVLARWTG
jgi:hypothetical protein